MIPKTDHTTSYEYPADVLLRTEPDGIRIISSDNCEFIHKVLGASLDEQLIDPYPVLDSPSSESLFAGLGA